MDGGMFMKVKLVYSILVILTILVTFFGLGPVLFADGTNRERMNTLLIVLACYLLIFACFYAVYKRRKNRKE